MTLFGGFVYTILSLLGTLYCRLPPGVGLLVYGDVSVLSVMLHLCL